MTISNVTTKPKAIVDKRFSNQLLPFIILLGVLIFLFFIFAYCFYNIFLPLKYSTCIKTYAMQYGVNPALIASVINAESKFDPNSISNKGAVGLMQIMPTTATFVANYSDIEYNGENELKNISKNIEIGVAYIKYLSNKFTDLFTMLCAYNAGEGNVMIWLKDSKFSKDGKVLLKTPYKETNFYARKVMRNMPMYTNRLK